MTTGLQAARNSIILKALLIRGLKGLAPLYTRIVEASEELEEGVEDSAQGVLVPVWGFLRSLDGLVDSIEERTDKEFPDADVEPEQFLSMTEAARRLAKSLREISSWAEKLTSSVSKLDPELSRQFEGIRDSAFGVAMNLEDLMVPEHAPVAREELLLLEYRKLSGIS